MKHFSRVHIIYIYIVNFFSNSNINNNANQQVRLIFYVNLTLRFDNVFTFDHIYDQLFFPLLIRYKFRH